MSESAQRKLAAILAADVAGYSRLMERDEEATLATLKAYRTVIDGCVAGHGGRVFNSAGDSVVAEFASPVEAVRCAVDIQADLAQRAAAVQADGQMRFRMGVNLGDVIVEQDNLYGDGVNVAARLETLSEPGGICISRNVYEMVEEKLDLAYDDLGEQAVKNIARPVHAYRVRVDGSRPVVRPGHRRLRRLVVWMLLLVLAVGGGLSLVVAPADKVPRGVPSVAVMPFDNIGGGAPQFSAGLTEDLVVALAGKTELQVVSGAGAGAVPAHYRLEGSVRQVDENLRITVSLVATDGVHLWGGRYDRAAVDTLVVQDEVAAKISASLAAELAVAGTAPRRSAVVRGLAAMGRLGERTLVLTLNLLAGGGSAPAQDVQ